VSKVEQLLTDHIVSRSLTPSERGVEKQVEVDGLSEQDVQKKFQELLT
jgi:hypothetical protein